MKLFYLIFPVPIQNSKNFYVFAHDTRDFVLDQEMAHKEIAEWLVGKRVVLVNSSDVSQHYLFNRLPRFPLPTKWPRSYEATLFDIRSCFLDLFNKKHEFDDIIYKNETNNLDNQGLLLYVYDARRPRFVDIHGSWSSDIFSLIEKINTWNVFVCGDVHAMPADLKRTVEWADDPSGIYTFARIQNKGNVSPIRIRAQDVNNIDAYHLLTGDFSLRSIVQKDICHSDDSFRPINKESRDIDIERPLEYNQDIVSVPRWAALALLRTGMNLSGGDLSDEIMLGCFETDRLMNVIVDKARPGFYKPESSYMPPEEIEPKVQAYHGYPPKNVPHRTPSPTYIRSDIRDSFGDKSVIGNTVSSPPSSKISQAEPMNLIDACKIALKVAPRFLSEIRFAVSTMLDRKLTNSDVNRVLYGSKDVFKKRDDGSWVLV